MNKEIERKFLIKKIPKGLIGTTFRQGYLQSEKERAVRIRTIEKGGLKEGFLTIKGIIGPCNNLQKNLDCPM